VCFVERGSSNLNGWNCDGQEVRWAGVLVMREHSPAKACSCQYFFQFHTRRNRAIAPSSTSRFESTSSASEEVSSLRLRTYGPSRSSLLGRDPATTLDGSAEYDGGNLGVRGIHKASPRGFSMRPNVNPRVSLIMAVARSGPAVAKGRKCVKSARL
jgi:hypothetical protein